MASELKDLRDLLDSDRGEPVEAAAVATAIQALTYHQVLYEDTTGVPREVLSLLRRHRPFFDRYFAAAGYVLDYDAKTQMFALAPRGKVYGWRLTRLKKDETLVRLACRLILEQGFQSGSMDEYGRVASDTDEIAETFRILAQADPPSEARLADILKDLHRLGAVRVGDRDRFERVTDLTMMPGLRVYVSDKTLTSMRTWLDLGCPGDFFEADAERRREEAAARQEGGRERDSDTPDGAPPGRPDANANDDE